MKNKKWRNLYKLHRVERTFWRTIVISLMLAMGSSFLIEYGYDILTMHIMCGCSTVILVLTSVLQVFVVSTSEATEKEVFSVEE